ncbi:Fic family protein [Mesorhizobium sp. J428]|uniref:Fic family protein n=1 Tax=Mesorhizobium sp. J428 TaxID=2898440 RepID=UPI0021506FA8|nr:Fic family protein [Mesorhizobium sp. J428]MCR5860146.1 Fic family protein [Mesorhizobium sp. J428]MCR5860174.1 Fic family protein [Mesorhizobium sp. J428]MCR5860181.1 Fic family protein [Mesorhizobium sp. J428]MCR5860210.1 Fic family protein [Mesorhizobium sp. J428]
MAAETERSELRERLEGFHTSKRLTELYLSPVGGNFDSAHLREINRRIFQDLPAAGFPEVKPGQFREPAPAGMDWVKHRQLDGLNVISHVAYSPMDNASIARLDDALQQIDVAKLSRLKTTPFVRAIGRLYSELDYIHPFPDGNSRTLREFTRELAEACGYNIDWTRFAAHPNGRNLLYVGRDLAVNELAMPHLRNDQTRRSVAFTQDQLAGNRDLTDLLRDAVLPGRAIAFRKLREPAALAAFPELATAFETMHKAEAFSREKYADDAGQRREFMDAVRKTVLERLDAGHTNDFGMKKNRPQEAERVRSPPSGERDR